MQESVQVKENKWLFSPLGQDTEARILAGVGRFHKTKEAVEKALE